MPNEIDGQDDGGHECMAAMRILWIIKQRTQAHIQVAGSPWNVVRTILMMASFEISMIWMRGSAGGPIPVRMMARTMAKKMTPR